MNAADVIREIMFRARISQHDIAELLGVRQATISRIKTGRNHAGIKTGLKLVRLAKSYKIDVDIEDLLEN